MPQKHGLTHILTHTPKPPERAGKHWREGFPLQCFVPLLHYLGHKIPHLFGGLFLHLTGNMGVGPKGEACSIPTEALNLPLPISGKNWIPSTWFRPFPGKDIPMTMPLWNVFSNISKKRSWTGGIFILWTN